MEESTTEIEHLMDEEIPALLVIQNHTITLQRLELFVIGFNVIKQESSFSTTTWLCLQDSY